MGIDLRREWFNNIGSNIDVWSRFRATIRSSPDPLSDLDRSAKSMNGYLSISCNLLSSYGNLRYHSNEDPSRKEMDSFRISSEADYIIMKNLQDNELQKLIAFK